MRNDPLAPLERETIVVARNVGLRRWVERELAHRLGVAAGLHLRSPRNLATSLAKTFVPEGHPSDVQQHPFEAAALAWRIRRVLGALPLDALYDRVHVYLDRAAERGETELPLATRLAALFDQYQVYRPNMLAAWSDGRLLLNGWPDEPWQADLWRRLRDDAPETTYPDGTVGPLLDRSAHLGRLLERLGSVDGARVEREVSGRVSVFGALVFPPLYWRVLGALARHVRVTVYTVAHGVPADAYSMLAAGAEPAHPLLRDLGGRTRDWVHVLSDLGCPEVEWVEVAEEPATALQAVQASIVSNAVPLEPATPPASDRSIRVLDCHSERRELEVLRDELLDAFDTLDGLRPGDVGVLVPDLPTYAPLIDAVFGAEDVGGARLPYHVAEHPLSPELRVLDAFHRVLALQNGRATASEVVGLLDVPSVRRRAELREADLGDLMEWVREARVHWGRDGEHKASFGLADDDVHTWRFGLDRLLLGVAVGPTDGRVLGRLPVAEATLDGAETLGRFAEWADALFGRLARFGTARAPSAWANDLLLFVDDLFEPRTEAELGALVTLRSAVVGLAALDAPTASFSDVRQHLAGALGVPERIEPFLTGKVTFADPLAVSHVPFRVLAVVGLGDAFPRTEAAPDFDAMGAAPLPGDPDTHATDRQVFLDAVMAARDRLLLSYVGRSHMDNAERTASVVLDAFLDTCRRTLGEGATDQLVVRHALQPFSPTYFRHARGDGAPTHFTYAAHLAPPAQKTAADGLRFFDVPSDLVLGDGDGDPAELVETTLEELARAWTHPNRYHCRHLGLDLRLDDAALDDDEPVVLDGLAFHGVKQVVLDGLLGGDTEAGIVDRLVASGRLPPGALGDTYVERAFNAVREVAGRIASHGEMRPVPIVVDGGVWRAEGVVQASDAGVLRARPSSVKAKDLIKGWVDHVAVCASDLDVARRTLVVGEGGASAFGEVPRDHARAILQYLVRGMLLFREAPPPLFEKASYEHAITWQKHADVPWKQRDGARRERWQQDLDQVVKAEGQGWRPVRVGRSVAADGERTAPFIHKNARKRYNGPFEDFSDVKDEAVALCYRRVEPLHDMGVAFDRWARNLWSPLLTYREDA